MISAASAPWLQPPDYLGAMSRGASAGAELVNLRQGAERIAQAGRQAADDLGYRYAALKSADDRAAAEAQAQKEHLTAAAELRSKEDAQKIYQWQTDEGQRNREIGIRESQAANSLRPKLFSTDNPIVSVDPITGQVKTLNPAFTKPTPPVRVSAPIYGEGVDPNTAALLGKKPFTVSGTVEQITPLLGTNAPASLRGTNTPAQLPPLSPDVNKPKFVKQKGRILQVNADGSSVDLGPE